VAAGDKPDRLATEASFAALRLNRGGNRDANRALWVIVLVRMATDPRTRQYVTRRTGQGLSKKEIIRCLKRHVAREIYRLLRLDALPAVVPDPARQTIGASSSRFSMPWSEITPLGLPPYLLVLDHQDSC
jgi:transposase